MYLFLACLILSASIESPEIAQSVQYPMYDAIDPEEYILGPGDVLWFSVEGGLPSSITEEYSGSTLYITITPDGYAVLPSAGAYDVSGLTLGEATSLMESGFSRTFPGIYAEIGLASLRTFTISITGHVVNPGMMHINGAQHLTEVLEIAGGIASSGTWTGVQIIHSNGIITEADITGFIQSGDIGSNPTLTLGDRIHVPQADKFIQIEGAVMLNSAIGSNGDVESGQALSSRGVIEYIPGETVSELINRIGGTTPWAERNNCYIVRFTAGSGDLQIPAPLDDFELDPEVMEGDQIVVPGIPPTVAVSGFVFSPGVYPHTAGMSVTHYISLAGGYEREASVSGIRIILPDGCEKKQDEIEVVPAGSIITVPRSWFVGWEDPLLIITSIATIVIAGIGLSQ